MARTAFTILATTTALAMLVGIGQASASDESTDPGTELTRLQAELASVTAERDALLEEATARAERYRRSSETQQAIIDIIADPAAFGSMEEVLDRLDELAVPGSTMDDVALGTAGWRDAWRGTLYGAQATLPTWVKWMADDGSIGGSLWTWAGSARNGESFDLPGIDVSTYDENGLITSVVVYWPYEDSEVACVFDKGNEACAIG